MFSSISVVIINFYGLYSPANIWGGFHFPFYSHSLPICIYFFIALFLPFRVGKVFPFKGGYFFFFWPFHTAYGILVPRPGIKLVSSALEDRFFKK